MRCSGTHVLLFKESPEKLLDGARVSIDRMPMLHVIFERVASQCSDAVRKLLPAPALFSLESLTTERIGDVIDRDGGNSVLGIMYVPVWDSRLIVGLRSDFVFAFADALFGGNGCEEPFSEERPLSNIEVRLAEKTFDLIGKSLQEAFEAICEAAFSLDRVETRTDFVTIAPRTAFGVKATIKVRIMGWDIALFILIPQSALNSIRQKLERDPSAALCIRDPRWSRQIKEEIGRTKVSIRGVIEEHQFTLADIAGLRAGQVMLLQADAAAKVKLECNAEPLFWCELGQADGFYTLRAGGAIGKKQNVFSDAAPN